MILHTCHNGNTFETPRGRLSGPEIKLLLENGVLEGANPDFINSASLDLFLGNRFLVETDQLWEPQHLPVISVQKGEEHAPKMHEIMNSVILPPGVRVLAHSQEVFNLPDTISAEVRVRSTAARRGLDHAFASWCDAGWHGSVLTLEFVNFNRFHKFKLTSGDRVVQVIFEAHSPAGEFSYTKKGRYNNSSSVEGGK